MLIFLFPTTHAYTFSSICLLFVIFDHQNLTPLFRKHALKILGWFWMTLPTLVTISLKLCLFNPWVILPFKHNPRPKILSIWPSYYRLWLHALFCLIWTSKAVNLSSSRSTISSLCSNNDLQQFLPAFEFSLITSVFLQETLRHAQKLIKKAWN